MFGSVRPVELVEWLLASGLHRVRFQLQMHKVVWDPKKQEVVGNAELAKWVNRAYRAPWKLPLA